MLPFHLILAAAAIVIMVAIVYLGMKAVRWAESRGMFVPHSLPAVMALLFGLFLNVATYAQSTLDIEIDLSNFWQGFNQFFNALFPPLAFIASISAALGFIFLIISALKNAFGGSRG